MEALSWDVVFRIIALMTAGATLFVGILKFIVTPLKTQVDGHERRIVKLETDIKLVVEKLQTLSQQETLHYSDTIREITALQKVVADSARETSEFFQRYGVVLDYSRQQMMERKG